MTRREMEQRIAQLEKQLEQKESQIKALIELMTEIHKKDPYYLPYPYIVPKPISPWFPSPIWYEGSEVTCANFELEN